MIRFCQQNKNQLKRQIKENKENLPSISRHQQITFCHAKIFIQLGKPKPKKNSINRLHNQGKIYYRQLPTNNQDRPKTTQLKLRMHSQNAIKTLQSSQNIGKIPNKNQAFQNSVSSNRNQNNCKKSISCVNLNNIKQKKNQKSINKKLEKQQTIIQLKKNRIKSLKKSKQQQNQKQNSIIIDKETCELNKSKTQKEDQNQLLINSNLKDLQVEQFNKKSQYQQPLKQQTYSQKLINQIKMRQLQRQKLMNLYNPVLSLFKYPLYNEQVRKVKIQPYFSIQNSSKVNISPSNVNSNCQRSSPNKSRVSFYQRAPIVKYLQGSRDLTSLYNNFMQKGQFKDQQFSEELKLQTINDQNQIQWIEQQFDQQKRFIFSQQVQLPKDFIKINHQYKNAPNGIINMINALLYVDPNIIKNIFQPDNELFYSIWIFKQNKNSIKSKLSLTNQSKVSQNVFNLNEKSQILKPIFVDKLLPYDCNMNSPFIYGNNQIWFSVLMKCLAKIYGGYEKLCFLTQFDVYKLITGMKQKQFRKQFINNPQMFKQQITVQMTKGYAVLFQKKNQLGIVKKVNNDSMNIIIPLKGEINVDIAHFLRDKDASISYIRTQPHWFVNSHSFISSKQSLYSFQINCQRQTRINLTSNKIISKMLIYEVLTVNKKKQQMNIRHESDSNYLDAYLKRGRYKIFLQCGKKHVSQYFNNQNTHEGHFQISDKKSKNNQKEWNKRQLYECNITMISCQQVIIKGGQQLKKSGSLAVQDKGSFYKAYNYNQSKLKKRFCGYDYQDES